MATSYTKTNWQDAPSTATPITAAQLNRMEKGIKDCSGQGNANELAIAANAEAIKTLESGIQLGSISITQLLLMAHPIGSIYSSTAATSPADLFGGTWEQLYNEATYVIEEGTSGIWNYRKWSDGTAECWGTYKFQLNLVDQFQNVWSGQSFALNLPSGLFVSSTSLDNTCVQMTTENLWSAACYKVPSDAVGVKCFSGYKYQNEEAYVFISVKGRWSTEVDNTPKYVWRRTA